MDAGRAVSVALGLMHLNVAADGSSKGLAPNEASGVVFRVMQCWMTVSSGALPEPRGEAFGARVWRYVDDRLD